MAQGRFKHRLSAREWGPRLALALAAAAVGYGAVTQSLATAWRTSAVERAYSLAPWNGPIAAALSEKLGTVEASAADRAEADNLARKALRLDPTAVTAVATLGLNADLRGDHAGASRLLAYAKRLSRRDIRIQLWAIQDSVARGNIADALKYYDIALRTSRTAPTLLFPVLSSAIADPTIRDGLVGKLAASPSWAESFIDYVSANGPSPDAISTFLRALRRKDVRISASANTAALNALLTAGMYDGAWSYYVDIHPKADRRISRDPHFEATTNSSPFEWILVNEAGISSSIQGADRGGLFEFAVSPGMGGAVLRQAQMLPPGEYRLEGHSVSVNPADAPSPYWLLSCDKGPELGRVSLRGSNQEDGNFSGRFIVPTGCPMQTLSLIVPAADGASGLSGQIDYLLLRPTG